MGVADTNTGETQSADGLTVKVLQEHQRAWETFGTDAVQLIPILKAQMAAVTQETERAALELMMHLQVLASHTAENTSKTKAVSLSQVVSSMQFQDITRQKLEHVSLALDQFTHHLQALMKGPLNEEAKREIAALEKIEKQYTMEEERRVHQATLSPEGPEYGEPVPTSLSEEGNDTVTLF